MPFLTVCPGNGNISMHLLLTLEAFLIFLPASDSKQPKKNNKSYSMNLLFKSCSMVLGGGGGTYIKKNFLAGGG